MKPLPVPCPAHLVPDASGLEAFNAAYRAAKQADTVYIGVERRGRRWTVKADTLTAAPGHTVGDTTRETVQTAVVRLARSGEIDRTSGPGPVHYTLNGITAEDRARELAAALHAALYGQLEPLARAVPAAPS